MLFASNKASSRLNLSDNFWSQASILASAEDLADLLTEADLTGLSVNDLAGLEEGNLGLSS